MAKIYSSSQSLQSLIYCPLTALPGDLSTTVYSLLWISVENLPIKALGHFPVDSRWIRHGTCAHVIHNTVSWLSHCKLPTTKKKLDQLSTYPHSLLKLLIYKIYYIIGKDI